MSSIRIILPYYGKLPANFAHWLRSAEMNETIDFLIVTDLAVSAASPNVEVINISLEELLERMETLYGQKIAFTGLHKLCDFKPLYGEIFADYVRDYDFWGYCDCDMIFGDIRAFITEDILAAYNSILGLGHLHLQRVADPLYAEVVRTTVSKGHTFSQMLSTDRTTGFDEMPFGVNAHYYKLHPQLTWTGFTPTGHCFADLTKYSPLFRDTFHIYKRYAGSFYARMSDEFPCWKREPGPYLRCTVYQKRGVKLFEVGLDEQGQIAEREVLYAHFSKRQVKVKEQGREQYLLIPNAIIPDRKLTPCYLRRVEWRVSPYAAFYGKRLKQRLKSLRKKLGLS